MTVQELIDELSNIHPDKIVIVMNDNGVETDILSIEVGKTEAILNIALDE